MQKTIKILARIDAQTESINLKVDEEKILRILSKAIAAGCAEIEQELGERFESYAEAEDLVEASLKLLMTRDRSILKTAIRRFARWGGTMTRERFRRDLAR